MEKQIKFLKSLYTKEAILYTVNLYLEEYNYEILEDDSNFIIVIKDDIEDETINFIKKELNFNNLRFQIANNNKDIRKVIISKALGSINIE